jgi:hypothetical protein
MASLRSPDREVASLVRSLGERQAASIQVEPGQAADYSGMAPAAANAPVERMDGGRRTPPPAEVEDLDIPAFLRRNR